MEGSWFCKTLYCIHNKAGDILYHSACASRRSFLVANDVRRARFVIRELFTMAKIEGHWINIYSSQELKHDGAVDGKKYLKQAGEQNLPTKGDCKFNSFFFYYSPKLWSNRIIQRKRLPCAYVGSGMLWLIFFSLICTRGDFLSIRTVWNKIN